MELTLQVLWEHQNSAKLLWEALVVLGDYQNLAAKGNALVAQELRLVPQAEAAYPQEAVYHMSNPTVGVPQAAAASLLKCTACILQLHAKVSRCRVLRIMTSSQLHTGAAYLSHLEYTTLGATRVNQNSQEA